MRFTLFSVAALLSFVPAVEANPGRFLDAELLVYDERLHQLIDADSRIEILAQGLQWAEGPVWAASLNALLFSDVAADTIYRWDDKTGLRVYLQPSGHAPDAGGTSWRGSNGLAIDASGKLLLAQQSNRRLARMSAPVDNPAPDFEVLANRYDGKSINSPNDLVVHRSGDIFFTDPPYGLAGFEKSPAIELDFFGVFRLDKDNRLIPVVRNIEKPNGIALSADQSTLYVSNSEAGKAQIIAIDLDGRSEPLASRVFFDGANLIAEGPGSTDGMTVHPGDYLFASLPNGFGVLSPAGELLGKFALGQVTNLAFDDAHSYLYITTPKRLLRLEIRPFQ